MLRSREKMLEFEPSKGKADCGAGLGQRPLVLGHRGDSTNHPENTLPAFEGALRAGADGVECDVRLSGDGVPIVFHDATLERTTNGSGRLADFSLPQLKELDAGRGERIPTVAEAADLLRGRGLLCIEFKEAEAVAPTVKVLTDADASDVVLCSFLPEALHACAESAPGTPALLICGSLSLNPLVRLREAFPISTVTKTGADGLSCHRHFISRRLAAKARRRGLALYIWCSMREESSPPEWHRRAMRFAPDALITAWPEHLVDYFESSKPLPPGRGTT